MCNLLSDKGYERTWINNAINDLSTKGDAEFHDTIKIEIIRI